MIKRDGEGGTWLHIGRRRWCLQGYWGRLVLEWRYWKWNREVMQLCERHEVRLNECGSDPQDVFCEIVDHKRKLGDLLKRDPKLERNRK